MPAQARLHPRAATSIVRTSSRPTAPSFIIQDAESGCHQRFRDPRGDGAEAALPRDAHRAEGGDDADDGAEETDERGRRRDGREHAQEGRSSSTT